MSMDGLYTSLNITVAGRHYLHVGDVVHFSSFTMWGKFREWLFSVFNCYRVVAEVKDAVTLETRLSTPWGRMWNKLRAKGAK